MREHVLQSREGHANEEALCQVEGRINKEVDGHDVKHVGVGDHVRESDHPNKDQQHYKEQDSSINPPRTAKPSWVKVSGERPRPSPLARQSWHQSSELLFSTLLGPSTEHSRLVQLGKHLDHTHWVLVQIGVGQSEPSCRVLTVPDIVRRFPAPI
eukprot:7391537-Prymnesium_polylepis.2